MFDDMYLALTKAGELLKIAIYLDGQHAQDLLLNQMYCAKDYVEQAKDTLEDWYQAKQAAG